MLRNPNRMLLLLTSDCRKSSVRFQLVTLDSIMRPGDRHERRRLVKQTFPRGAQGQCTIRRQIRGKRMQRIFPVCALAALLSVAGLAGGQVNPGTPPFSAYDVNSPDIINLQNLNIILTAPVHSKAGAIRLNWGLTGDSYMYQTTNGSLVWMPSMVQYGVVGTLNGSGWATANYTASYSINCPDGVTQSTKYYDWVITTSDFTQHAFPASDWTD